MPPHKKLGTLVVVVLKARNLKDSHTFYKQDPYALIRLGGTGKQTSADQRGGQHPVWDEELHFPVSEVVPKVDQRTLIVAVYSKESKVGELIGEGKIDISETLMKGEFDDWIRLELNGSYSGEVYLEMTFYSKEPPLTRRPSRLLPKDRIWRPPVIAPKNTTSQNVSLHPSPRTHPNPRSSPGLRPYSSPHLPPTTYPVPSSLLPAAVNPSSLHRSSPQHQACIDPTLKNIPFLELDRPASSIPQPPHALRPALYSVPSILRPCNVMSSPIPLAPRNGSPLVPANYDDANKRFLQELADGNAPFAAKLAPSEGIDVDLLRAVETDVARRIETEDEIGEQRIPGGWVE